MPKSFVAPNCKIYSKKSKRILEDETNSVQSKDDKSKASPRQNSTTQLSSPAVHPFSCTSSGFSIWKHVPSLATPPSETHHRPHPTPKDHPHSYATHPYYRFCSTYGSILNHGLNWTRMLAPPPFPALPSTPRMLYWKFPNYFNHFFPMEFRPPSSSPDLGSPLLHSQRTDLSASNTEQISTRTSSADENSRSIQSAPTTSNRKYSCDLCGRTFSRTNTLVTHRRIHTGEKPFSCDICGRPFRQPGNLTRHRAIHNPRKAFNNSTAGFPYE